MNENLSSQGKEHYFDAHCHLQDDKLWPRWPTLWSQAQGRGVRSALCCGTKPADWQRVSTMAASGPGIIPAYGVHPWYAHELDGDWLESLNSHLQLGTCALGEVGLDGRFAKATLAKQMEILSQQLDLAKTYDLPVSLHCVDAWNELLELLGACPGLSFNIHAFGQPAYMDELLALGAFFSFNGAIAYQGYGKMKRALGQCPLDRLLLETDAPDFPLAIEGKVDKSLSNVPANLPLIANAAAALLEMDVLELSAQCWQNARAYLGERLSHKYLVP